MGKIFEAFFYPKISKHLENLLVLEMKINLFEGKVARSIFELPNIFQNFKKTSVEKTA